MKLYLFTMQGNYGQFIEIVCAKRLDDAWDISKAKKRGWDKNDSEELKLTEVAKTIFEGGGDNG